MSSNLYTLPGRAPAPITRGEKVSQWVFTHRAQLGLAAGVFALAALLAVTIAMNRRKLAERGAEQLSAARFQASQDKHKEALQILDELINAQRTGPVALQAYLMKGDLLFAQRKFGEAAAVYEEGSLQSTLPDYKALILLGRASAAVELNKYPEAAGFYKDFLRDFPDHFLAPRALMESARLSLALQQPAEARETLERLLMLYPKSPWVAGAQALLSNAKALLPPEPAVPSPNKNDGEKSH
jgi:TolA-binding protein